MDAPRHRPPGLQLGPLGRRRRARHGQLHHARRAPARGGVHAARRGLQPGAAVRRRGPAVRTGRAREPGASDDVATASMSPDPDGPRYADDVIMMPLQCATQWDSLAHVHYGGQLYNGHAASTLTPAGAARNGIDKLRGGHRVARRAARRRARARRRAPPARAGDHARRSRGGGARAGRARRVGRRAAGPHRPHAGVHARRRPGGLHEADAGPRHRRASNGCTPARSRPWPPTPTWSRSSRWRIRP